ncbi:MAG: phosphoribosylglycinamide formyltransferase [Acidobacteria bacterium]|nr:phosphoribosylglycinamide formyltransferase [Acidobacteriota bacterium]
MKRVGILISGRGSNMEALILAATEGKMPAKVALVISNVPTASGLERARAAGVEAVCIPSLAVHREEHERLVVAELRNHEVDLVCLAGYMRLLTPYFINAFPHAILNIHPSLLPAFPGIEVQREALRYGVKFSGCTVHFVDESMDHGPIILQSAVPVLDDDTPETLSARILAEEHRIYPKAVGIVLSGKYSISGRRVIMPPIQADP